MNRDPLRTRRRPRCLRFEPLEDRSTPTVISLTADKDNTLYEHATGQLSNGAGLHLYVGKTGALAGQKVRRTVVEFDLTSIPIGSTINSATLTMHVSRDNNGSQTVAAHQLLSEWGEGTSNAGPGAEGDGTAPSTGDATWTHTFFNTQSWTTPGGDFDATESASRSVSFIGSYDWTGANLLADVQQWFGDPSTNHGWILIGNESAAPTAKEFDSSESSTPSDRPTLTIDYTTPPSDLTVDKSHTGDFRQGDAADTYSLIVNNVGTGPTSGLVSVSDTLPTGLTPTAANNGAINGWNVSFVGQTITATRSNALNPGNPYPALTITVAVAADAPANVVNTATVSGGGQVNTANDSDVDPTAIIQVADLTIAKSHVGDFTQGDNGRSYTIEVSNVGPGPTTGSVTITDVLPNGLIPTAANNGVINGWNVSTVGQTVTATRSDALDNGANYPDLPLIVDVDFAASNVVNTATVAGGGEIHTGNNTDNDPTTILPYSQPNQEPENTLPANYSTDEDVALTLSGISIADVDVGNANVQVTFTTTIGTLTLDTLVNGGVAAGQVTGNGTGNVVMTAKLSAINTTLASVNGLRYSPNENANGNETLTMTTDDLGHHGTGGPKTDTDIATIAIAALNDAPKNTLPATNSTPADTPLVITGVSVTDADADGNSVSVVLNVNSGTLTLNTSAPGGLVAANVSGNGTHLITVFAPLAKINATLAHASGLTFAPPAAFFGDVTLTLMSNDLGSTGPGGPKSDTDLQAITVTNVLDHFTIDMQANTVAGEPFQVTVTARDSFGNAITNYGGSIDLATTDPQGVLPPSATFTNGQATFNATLKTAGSHSITATDSAVPSVSIQDSIVVDAAAIADLAFDPQPIGTVVNAPFAIRVVARDAFGNLAANANEVIQLGLQFNSVGAALMGTTSAALVNGVATYSGLRITKAGNFFKLSASTSSTPAVVSDPFSVTAVARFAVTTTRLTSVAGDAFTISVRALDARGQIVSTYGGKVHFTSSDPQAVLPADATLNFGQSDFVVTLRKAGKMTITAADSAKPTVRGSLKPITILPGAVSALRATGLDAPAALGRRNLLTIHAVDVHGNVNPGYRGTVILTSTNGLVVLGSHTFIARDAGKFAFPVILDTAGLQSIAAGDGTLSIVKRNIVAMGPTAAVLSIADPGDATKTATLVLGTAKADVIEVLPTNAAGTQVEVRINGTPFGTTFAPTGHLLIYGVGGNDSIRMLLGEGAFNGVAVAIPTMIDGGLGNDNIIAGASSAILVGGDGNDVISGSMGRDLIVGGRGKDLMNGIAGEDILIGGTTKHDADLMGLLKLRTEWTDTGTTFLKRVHHLQGIAAGGANDPYFLNAASIPNDNAIDQLIGGDDTDWFVFGATGLVADQLNDPESGEMLMGL